VTQKLAGSIDHLYQLPLGEFTSARNTLAKTLSGSEKKAIASLVKPSLPMWVINQLYWQDAPSYNALIDAAEKLRAAHRAVLSGRKADTRSPDQLHRATVEKALSKSVAIAEKDGVRLTDAVRDTIRHTLAALPGDEPPGHLTRPPEPAGFSLLAGIKPRPAAAHSVRPAAGAAERKSSRREDMVRQKRAQREQKQAERRAQKEAAAARRAQEKARKDREKRERDIRKAEQALREAERRLAELKR
jgi:hypothetical protein